MFKAFFTNRKAFVFIATITSTSITTRATARRLVINLIFINFKQVNIFRIASKFIAFITIIFITITINTRFIKFYKFFGVISQFIFNNNKNTTISYLKLFKKF